MADTAAKNIKGITIEINGDVTKLDRALSQVDKDLNTTQKNLKEVERLLKLDPKNVELLDQKQRLLAQGVELTSKKYETLKKTLENATASNVKFAEWEKAQSSLQGQITKTENALSKLYDEQKKMQDLNFAPDSSQMQALQREIDETKEKSEALRQKMADTFEELGRPISIDQYDALQRELVQSKDEMEKASKAAKDFESGAEDMGNAAETAGEHAGGLRGALEKLGISLTLDVGEMLKTGAQLIGKLAGAMKDTVRDAAAFADEILTLSTNYGISTEKLQEYKYMAELTDTSVETITGSIKKLTANMDNARGGTGAAAQAFERLGISVTNSDGTLRDANTVFEETIDALGKMEAGTERDALAQDLFGKSAADLNSLIAAGAEGVREYAKEAHELGYVMSGEELDALGKVDDQFQRMETAMDAAKRQIAIELAPVILSLTDNLLELIGAVDWDKVRRVAGETVDFIDRRIDGLISTTKALIGIISKVASAAASAASAISNFFSGAGNAKLMSGYNNRPAGHGSRYPNGVRAYASGGVFEPNNPMLIGIGDNRTEREVVTPESLMRRVVREETGGNGGNFTAVIQFAGTDDQIIRALAPKLRSYDERLGVTL